MSIEDATKKLKKFCDYEDSVVLIDNALIEIQDAIEIVLGNLEALCDMQSTADKKIKELEEENRKLKVVRSEYDYGYENTYFITKNDLVQIDKNKYLIEIEEGKFVDLKQVYLDNKNGMPEQKIKDKIDEINKKYEDSKDENGESPYYYPEYTIRVLEKLLQESEDK